MGDGDGSLWEVGVAHCKRWGWLIVGDVGVSLWEVGVAGGWQLLDGGGWSGPWMVVVASPPSECGRVCKWIGLAPPPKYSI